MFNTFLKLFGKSPFAPLASHMKMVSECVYMVQDLFKLLEEKDYKAIEQLATTIRKTEHKADIIKNQIRNKLPKNIFLPIDRGNFLEILSIQDSIADIAENIGVLINLKKLEFLDAFKSEFELFLAKVFEVFEGCYKIIEELPELLESSFGGKEADKVRMMVEKVAFKEDETDQLQAKLVKKLIQSEDKMTYTTFYLWQKIFVEIGRIADLSENLAYHVRRTLELK